MNMCMFTNICMHEWGHASAYSHISLLNPLSEIYVCLLFSIHKVYQDQRRPQKLYIGFSIIYICFKPKLSSFLFLPVGEFFVIFSLIQTLQRL